jgi:hypothetical protein
MPDTHPDSIHPEAQFGNIEHLPETTQGHETILQGLDQWVPTDLPWIPGKKAYYGVPNFEGTENEWDSVPLIFTTDERPKHPSDKALRENAAAELARINGRLAGKLTGSQVHTSGTPRLSSRIQFSDPEVQEYYNLGKLAHSTGFSAASLETGHLVGKVKPSHVLLFVRGEHAEPNDPKAMFLNTKPDQSGIWSEIHNTLKSLVSLFEKSGQPAEMNNLQPPEDKKMTPDPELPKQLEFANLKLQEKDSLISAKDKEITDLKAKVTEFENLKKSIEEEKKNARWSEMKNCLSKGLTHTEDEEKKLRTEFETDPGAFAIKMLQHGNTKAQPKGKDGAEFVNTKQTASDEDRLRKLGIPSITISGGAE